MNSDPDAEPAGADDDGAAGTVEDAGVDDDGDGDDGLTDRAADPGPGGDGGTFTAVLFDMDGVLVDSEPHWNAFEEAFVFAEATAGKPTHEEVTGMNYREIYDYLDGEYGVVVPRETFLGRYEAHADRVYGDLAAPMPGTADVLATVRDAGVTTGIVSSSRRRWIGRVLARLGLEPLDLAMSAEEIPGPGKPAPDVYEDAARRLRRAPDDCVVIEDSRNGVRAGVAAGCYTVGFRAGHNADYDLSMADEVVDGADELRALLDELLG
jgi:HAD superfamily hydrolase (TIGR01509 family)